LIRRSWRSLSSTFKKLRRSEAGAAGLGADCLGDDPERVGHVVGGLPDLGDRIVLPLRAAFQVGDDQVVLGREVPVERHLGDADLSDDLLRAHRAQPLRVEQRGRGLDNALSHRDPWRRRCTGRLALGCGHVVVGHVAHQIASPAGQCASPVR
jgi:hypothetical protein